MFVYFDLANLDNSLAALIINEYYAVNQKNL